MVRENLRACDKGNVMVMTRFVFIIAIDEKLCFGILRITTLKRHRLLPDDKGEKTTKETAREGSRGNPGFFLGGCAPLRNGTTYRCGKQILNSDT